MRSPLARRMVRQIHDMTLALVLCVCATAVVYADERLQGWIPEVLMLPEDAEVVTDRAIGSVRMFSIVTDNDVDELFTDWEESLNSNGYPVNQETNEMLDRSIEFTGPGIVNAKIIASPATEDGLNVIEFDATLD